MRFLPAGRNYAKFLPKFGFQSIEAKNLRIFILFYALFLSLFLPTTVAGEGFAAGTLVRIPTGYMCIQDLCATDEILVCTFDDSIVSAEITHVTIHEVDTIVRLEVEGDIVELAEDQLLFVPLQRTWIPASQIHEGMYLLGAPLRAMQVQSVERIDQRLQVYALTLNEHHNYLVGKYGIVVHNFGSMVFGAVGAAEGLTFLNVFLAANPLVAPMTIAVGGAGLIGGLIWKAIGEIKESKKSYKKDKNNDKSSGGQPEDPKKPKNDNQDKDFLKSLKLRSDKRARTNRFGNLYRDPKTKLWWSKDLAGHGKSCYKVFKETARGLEWIFDATAEGLEIMGKHKGPTGLFIPYKEVIF